MPRPASRSTTRTSRSRARAWACSPPYPTARGCWARWTWAGWRSRPSRWEGSPNLQGSGPLFNFGIGDAVNAGANGKVCLIARGTVDFTAKVSNCQLSGGTGAVIYNNAPGAFSGTLGTTVSSIPSVSIAQEDGNVLLGRLGQASTVAVAQANYAYYDSTSMATPHVSAVAAPVWSYFTPAAPTAAELLHG